MLKKLCFIGLMMWLCWAQALTYQGELSQTGALFNGYADMRFSLYDAATNGTEVGMADLHSQVEVIDGRFVVELEHVKKDLTCGTRNPKHQQHYFV